MLLVGRPQSFLEPYPQPGKPPVLICPPVLILVLSSGFSMPSRAKRTPPKTLLFPFALPLLTLPITMPLYLRSHLSQATPRTSRRAERQFMNELRKASCEDASYLHNSFCSPFSLAELSTAICKLSSSTAPGPDQIAYPLLKRLPEPAQLLRLSLFNRSWYSHIFSFCWKSTTITAIHKPGKPTSSPSSLCSISLTSCISKLFKRLILSRLTFHLESNYLLSICQAGFRPGRSSLDQIFTLSQSIWDGFQKKKPPDRTILASVDFSMAFDSVWHSALFHKPPCFVLWVRSFLSDRKAKVQVGGSRSLSFRIRQGAPQGSVLGPVLFILFVDDITKDLPRGAHASLYADDLAIWSSSPDPLKTSSVVQSSLTVLETWSNLWTLSLNPKKCKSSFFSTDPHQATFQPRLNLLGIYLLFNPTPKFLGVTFDRTLFVGAHVQSLRSKFYSRHKALRSIATVSWGPTKESLSLLYKAFVRPVLTYASPGWFPFLCNTATNHLVVLPRAACRVITGCLSSTPSSLLLLEAQLPPLKLILEHQAISSFERALRLLPDFSSFYALATRNVPCRLKKKPSWRSFCSSVTQPLPSPRETLIMCPLSPQGLQPTSLFPPSFPTARATVQPDSSLLQADYPPFPILISKYGLTDRSPPFLVPVVLECMSHAPDAIHPIPCPFPLVQLPPASQLKPLPSSKVSIGVLAI